LVRFYFTDEPHENDRTVQSGASLVLEMWCTNHQSTLQWTVEDLKFDSWNKHLSENKRQKTLD